MKLSTVCVRAGVDPEVAQRALVAADPSSESPWAKEVEIDGQKYVVGQGKHPGCFVCLPCPFPGHSDEWKVILPIGSADDLLKQLEAK